MGGRKMELKSFITIDMLKNLAGCILVVELFTETMKLLIETDNRTFWLWTALIFSIFVSFSRLFLTKRKITKRSILLAIVNSLTIFWGSVGTYQAGIKQITIAIKNSLNM